MLKILFLTNSITPKIEEVFFNYLVKAKHKFIAITKSEKRSLATKRIVKDDYSLYLMPYQRSIVSVIFNIFRRLALIKKLIKQNNFNVIHVRNGVTDGFLSIYLKRKLKIPLIFQLSFPTHLRMQYHGLYSKRYRNIYFILGKIREFLILKIISKVDLFLPQSNFMLKYFQEKGVSRNKMIAHPSGVNHLKFNPKLSGKERRKKLGLLNSKVLLYLGRIDRIRNLRFLVKVFLTVRKQYSNVKLLVIGDGNERNSLEKTVYERNLQNEIIFTGKVKYSNIPSFIAASDICISPLPPNLIFKMSTPTKVYEYLSMEKPIVVSDIPEQREIISKSQAGLCVSYSINDFSTAICNLLNNIRTFVEMGKRGREVICKHYTYDILTQKLIHYYKKLLE